MKIRNDIDGLIFFDKKSGTNFLFDEIKIAKPDIAPRHISIALTNRCNMMCSDCYIIQNNQELDFQEVKCHIDHLNEHGCLSIGLGGGEPTLWTDLLKLLDYINTTKMGITLTTNGTASFEYYCQILKRINLLRFSVDGLGPTYEFYRKQSFDLLIKKITKLSKLENKVGLNYLLTDKTVLQLDEFVELINKIRPIEVLLIPCLDKNRKRLLSKQSETLIKTWVQKHKETLPLAFSYSSIDIVQNEALPIQDFDITKQHNYFLHINANNAIMHSVFDSSPIPIRGSIIETLKNFGGTI